MPRLIFAEKMMCRYD